MYQVYTNIYQEDPAASLTYTGIYPVFASQCLYNDLPNSEYRIPCNGCGMCIHADSSIRNFHNSMKKLIQNIAGG